MATAKTMIEQAYTALNKRDIDGALALMTQDVSWQNIGQATFARRSALCGLRKTVDCWLGQRTIRALSAILVLN